jgi:DNA-binding transcriptional ArsR family regulator
MPAPADRETFTLIARRMKAMADPARLLILHCLCGGERNVTELVGETRLTQANVSKHLRVLSAEGLLNRRRNHRNIYYSLKDDLPREVCRLVCESLEGSASEEMDTIRNYWRNNE